MTSIILQYVNGRKSQCQILPRLLGESVKFSFFRLSPQYTIRMGVFPSVSQGFVSCRKVSNRQPCMSANHCACSFSYGPSRQIQLLEKDIRSKFTTCTGPCRPVRS